MAGLRLALEQADAKGSGMSEPTPQDPPVGHSAGNLREINILAGAEALAAMDMVRGVARVVCMLGVPLSVFIVIAEIHARFPLSYRLPLWMGATTVAMLVTLLGFSFAIRTMRPLVGCFVLAASAGPALWALFQYSASFGSWEEKWREHIPVIVILTVLSLPLVIAWWRVARLDGTLRQLARSAPRLNGFGDLWRETFGIWPGVRRNLMQTLLSTFFSYLSALVVWVGVLILTPVAILVFMLLPLIAQTKGFFEVVGPLVVVLVVFLFLVFLQNALSSAARWCSRAALADKVEQDPRPPVLFLRSFQDDQVQLPERGTLSQIYRRIVNLGLGRLRLDHLLVERFARYGPAIALGNPGEKNLPFGAARIYASHDNWKNVVLELATRSAHVVLVADSTPGVEWEVQTFLERPLLDKTLFLCAPRSEDLRESPQIGRWLTELGLPSGGTPVLAAFRGVEGNIMILRCAAPRSSSAFVTALQAFFRLRSSN